MKINLISDTITQPTPAMLQAMFSAKVGDDVFQHDPTVIALQQKIAAMFGMEDALFCPSGTMTNQIAIRLHTQYLDEMVCDIHSHVYQYETGGYAANSGAAVKLLQGTHGKIDADQIAQAINPPYDWLPRTKLVVLENTTNRGGGAYYTLEEVRPISEFCKKNQLKLHLDGARIFNALVETKESPIEWGKCFDSISICLSKGLGAPVGSLLLGKSDWTKEARRIRKAWGGGMRQVGYLAAAGIYALDHHIERLKDDHQRARILAAALSKLPFVTDIRPVKTNILIFDLIPSVTAEAFLEKLAAHHIFASAFGKHTVRFVTHLDFTDEMLDIVLETFEMLFF